MASPWWRERGKGIRSVVSRRQHRGREGDIWTGCGSLFSEASLWPAGLRKQGSTLKRYRGAGISCVRCGRRRPRVCVTALRHKPNREYKKSGVGSGHERIATFFSPRNISSLFFERTQRKTHALPSHAESSPSRYCAAHSSSVLYRSSFLRGGEVRSPNKKRGSRCVRKGRQLLQISLSPEI